MPLGIKDPPFPGGLISNGSVNGTPEFAYGVTDQRLQQLDGLTGERLERRIHQRHRRRIAERTARTSTRWAAMAFTIACIGRNGAWVHVLNSALPSPGGVAGVGSTRCQACMRGFSKEPAAAANAPLAVRMRPRTLDDIVGQRKLVGPRAPLRRAIENGRLHSMILHGPPGSGKTTLAR